MNDSQNYNPDVLNCLANLSNDEVFTSPEIANKILDMLPKEIWNDPNAKFLDPFAKSGVFLREITKRLLDGLKEQIPDLQDRIDHILHDQVYGIAITELTSLLCRRSLYCTKYPNSKFSISKFSNVDGNIRFKVIKHTWKNGVCVYCGANKNEYKRSDDLETYAYEFIHTEHPERILNMKFDVIIGNPPYQLNDGGSANGMSAKPIYQHFVENSLKLNPKYLCMIIPARWYSGGKGLDDFRALMLNDKHITNLVDYENYKDVFAGLGGLAGGVCYFLRERDRTVEKCKITNFYNDNLIVDYRPLNEFDFFIRSNRSIDIIKKISIWNKENNNSKLLSDSVSVRLPFGITTTYTPVKDGVPCYFTQKIGKTFVKKEDIVDKDNLVNKWKFLAPKAPIAGQTDFTKPVMFFYEGNTIVSEPGTVCSESWLVLKASNNQDSILKFKNYVLTKCFRFLLLQTVVSQNITKKNYCFIPDLSDELLDNISDEYLKKIWNLSEDDWNYIDSKISNKIESDEN